MSLQLQLSGRAPRSLDLLFISKGKSTVVRRWDLWFSVEQIPPCNATVMPEKPESLVQLGVLYPKMDF